MNSNSKRIFAILMSVLLVFSLAFSGTLVSFAVVADDYTGGDEPIIDIPAHDHVYTGWTTNAQGHWHYCTVCNQEIDYATHTESDWIVDFEPSGSSNGQKHIECTVCGYIIETAVIPNSSSHIPGDINNDGDVDNRDLTRLFQYLSDWDVAVNVSALDVNGDGDIDNRDLTRLFQYLSDWDVRIY